MASSGVKLRDTDVHAFPRDFFQQKLRISIKKRKLLFSKLTFFTSFNSIPKDLRK